MNTLRLILPALLTMLSILSFVWIVAYYLAKEITPKDGSGKEAKAMIFKIAKIISVFVLFFGTWWLISILSVNEIPRSKQDRTLNKEMKNSFEDRMEKELSKNKTK